MARKSASQAEFHEADNNNSFQLDPIIEGLIQRLPAPGDVFPPHERALWLQIIPLVFQLIYLDKEPDEPNGEQT